MSSETKPHVAALENGNRPAMPVFDPQAPASDYNWVNGLTKREYFAAMALGDLAGKCGTNDASGAEHIARSAVKYADALLAALGGDDE